jgi:hypothetical protein
MVSWGAGPARAPASVTNSTIVMTNVARGRKIVTIG